MKKEARALQYDKLYNSELKKSFIEKYDSLDSKLTMFWQFLKITDEEFEKDKDLYDMDFNEIFDLLESAECSSINSAINHINTYKRYIDYCIDLGLTNRNPLVDTDEPLSEIAKQVVADYKNKRYTREQLLEEMINPLIAETENYNDGALLLALFEGIKGKGFSELLSLRMNDDTFEELEDGSYLVHLYDSEARKHRELTITNELYKLLKYADSQTHYRTNNKDEDVETPFNETEFIFKKAKKGKQGNVQMLDRHFITRKFVFFKEKFGNTHLTADDIFQSGMMDMAYRLYQENGKLGREELLQIGEQYDTLMATSDGKTFYRNITHLKRLIFTDSFKKMYGNIEYAD